MVLEDEEEECTANLSVGGVARQYGFREVLSLVEPGSGREVLEAQLSAEVRAASLAQGWVSGSFSPPLEKPCNVSRYPLTKA